MSRRGDTMERRMRPNRFMMAGWLWLAGVLVLGGGGVWAAEGRAASRAAITCCPQRFVGYTEYRTNLPGGRHANVVTMRACIVRADGTGRRRLAEELTGKPNTWTQFAGFSPDGRVAIIGNGWESPENAAWEEEHKAFRMTEGWLYDMVLLDLATGKLTVPTAIERVSDYNSGLFYWPKNPKRLGFQALIDGQSHPFSMDLDGRNKTDLTKDSKEFAYGFDASPDGRRIAYHKSYQVYLADANGANARRIETGHDFNFCPIWSPDGKWVTFLSGEHYNCHPYVVRRDGSGLRKLADRGGYRGVVEFLDVPDFHGGSSDVPVWSRDSAGIYFTAKRGKAVELMYAGMDGRARQLTRCGPGALNYHPKVSPDGKWLVFGSNRTGTRQLYVMRAEDGQAYPITDVGPGWGAMWAYWQP
jgi:TolB protein